MFTVCFQKLHTGNKSSGVHVRSNVSFIIIYPCIHFHPLIQFRVMVVWLEPIPATTGGAPGCTPDRSQGRTQRHREHIHAYSQFRSLFNLTCMSLDGGGREARVPGGNPRRHGENRTRKASAYVHTCGLLAVRQWLQFTVAVW